MNDAQARLYSYIDETGQDTIGQLFVVGVAMVATDRDLARNVLAEIERGCGKGSRKWAKSTRAQKEAYLDRIDHRREFRLFYSHYPKTTKYQAAVIRTGAAAIKTMAPDGCAYKVTVLVDGLDRRGAREVAIGLHRWGIHVRKVRGLRDECDEFIRLADAVAGFSRDHIEGNSYAAAHYAKIIGTGVLTEIP